MLTTQLNHLPSLTKWLSVRIPTKWLWVRISLQVVGIFKIALRLSDRYVFKWPSLEILNIFNTLTWKQIFWKMKTFFKKLEYRFLVECTKIENARFQYKTALSEANVKTNRMRSTNWTYRNERSFASNYFNFLRKLFQFRTSDKKLISYTKNPIVYIHIFMSLEFHLRVIFTCECP